MRELHCNGSVAVLLPVFVDLVLPISEPIRGFLLYPRDKHRFRGIDVITLLQNKQEETLVQIKITFSKAKKKLNRIKNTYRQVVEEHRPLR